MAASPGFRLVCVRSASRLVGPRRRRYHGWRSAWQGCDDQPVTVVDPDRRETWPSEVVSWVEERARVLRGTTNNAPDLKMPSDGQDEFRALFAGKKVLAHHFTRLLDHEIESIRAEGLYARSPKRLSTRGSTAPSAWAR